MGWVIAGGGIWDVVHFPFKHIDTPLDSVTVLTCSHPGLHSVQTGPLLRGKSGVVLKKDPSRLVTQVAVTQAPMTPTRLTLLEKMDVPWHAGKSSSSHSWGLLCLVHWTYKEVGLLVWSGGQWNNLSSRTELAIKREELAKGTEGSLNAEETCRRGTWEGNF